MPTKLHNPKHFLRGSEVCQRYDIATNTLYGWVKRGFFPKPKKFGWISRWNRQEVEAFEIANGFVADEQEREAGQDG